MSEFNKKQRANNGVDSVIKTQSFVAAKRFKTEKAIRSLEAIAYNASLAADRARVAALDGEASYSVSTVKYEQALAATARTEIILRQIFN
ncbi:hypothetical protein A9Q99_05320 [Gammaproteobacteria bacterium 45_16_T64]|nr:hypothetical protein A9Q99_05320 [Gammaproteobacteria bacterium 45_16_T64]